MARFSQTLCAAALMAVACVCPAEAQLSGGRTEANNTLQVHIREPGAGPASESLQLPLGQAAVIHLPEDAADVVIANDEVASAVVRTTRRAFVMGQAVGRTNIFFFNADGGLILDLNVRVERDIAALQDALDRFVRSMSSTRPHWAGVRHVLQMPSLTCR